MSRARTPFGLLLARALPRRLISRLVGQVAGLGVPPPLRRVVYGAWARILRIPQFTGAEVSSFRSAQELFGRPLPAPGAPVPSALSVVSPSAGQISAAGVIGESDVIVVKGQPYPLTDLLGEASDGPWAGGTYQVVWLAPSDHHRFYWPLTGALDRVVHLPGDLFPVHGPALESVPGVLARNERVTLCGRSAAGFPFALVAVGALNVGSIHLSFMPLRTNRPDQRRPRLWNVSGLERARGRAGDPLGHFALGSSLVLILAPATGRLAALTLGTRLAPGDAIGNLSARH